MQQKLQEQKNQIVNTIDALKEAVKADNREEETQAREQLDKNFAARDLQEFEKKYGSLHLTDILTMDSEEIENIIRLLKATEDNPKDIFELINNYGEVQIDDWTAEKYNIHYHYDTTPYYYAIATIAVENGYRDIRNMHLDIIKNQELKNEVIKRKIDEDMNENGYLVSSEFEVTAVTKDENTGEEYTYYKPNDELFTPEISNYIAKNYPLEYGDFVQENSKFWSRENGLVSFISHPCNIDLACYEDITKELIYKALEKDASQRIFDYIPERFYLDENFIKTIKDSVQSGIITPNGCDFETIDDILKAQQTSAKRIIKMDKLIENTIYGD